jgi:hypothetical protein
MEQLTDVRPIENRGLLRDQGSGGILLYVPNPEDKVLRNQMAREAWVTNFELKRCSGLY